MNIWRDRLQRWFSPIARRCPLSPNAVTVLALLLQLVAATLLYLRLFLVAIVLVIIGGLADAFDGIVARVQQKESRFGDFLDHFADRVADLALAAAWMLGSGVRGEIAIVVLIAHRPSALAGCDKILFLVNGMQQSFGPRDEVLRKIMVRPVAPA